MPTVDPNARASVEIYRPFFIAGLLSVLTAGCLLGAVALLGISMNGSYTVSAWTPYVLAHANSQLYGWVGFFIMGFALQQHAPSVGELKLFHRLAAWSLALMAIGIGVRFAAEPLAEVNPGLWVPIGVGSCFLQTIAVMLFLTNTAVTRHRSGEKLVWQTVLVFCSLFWLSVIAIAEPIWFAKSHGPDTQSNILFVAQWFPPYREAQFLGFVSMMIFGVALVKMNSCFGADKACPKLGLSGFAIWNLGLLMRMFGWVYAFGQNLAPESMAVYHLGGATLATAAILLVFSSRMFAPLSIHAPSQKFVHAAFVWLLLGAFLMALEPLHLRYYGHPFSHAYIGAVRHAITVGFISQMVLGVGMHVAARMNDLPSTMEKPLWATFWLLNLGNAARVALEIATDYSPSAFKFMGMTGFVELTGIAIWGAYIFRILVLDRRVRRPATPDIAASAGAE